jgi:hypothetical protein
LAGLVGLAVPPEVRGQGLSLDISTGHVVYDPVSAGVPTNNVVGTLRYDAPRGLWIYGTAATPLRHGDPVWGTSGIGGRVVPSGSRDRRATFGADLGAHGFLFRDAVVDEAGRGVTIDAFPFVQAATGRASVEVRGGWRGHTLSYAGATQHRGVVEAGLRATYGAATRVEGDARWVHAREGTYPFVGGTLVSGSRPLQVWLHTGRWLSPDLDDVTWGAGLQLALGSRRTVWASVQQDGPDPLFWNMARRIWSVGMTHRLGGRSTPTERPLVPLRQDVGSILLRVSAADVPGPGVSIAGDFTNWQPTPMRREGDDWVIRLTLPSGVYRYAFRAGASDWFVPASEASRRSDGMGGHVAVLVVH